MSFEILSISVQGLHGKLTCLICSAREDSSAMEVAGVAKPTVISSPAPFARSRIVSKYASLCPVKKDSLDHNFARWMKVLRQ